MRDYLEKECLELKKIESTIKHTKKFQKVLNQKNIKMVKKSNIRTDLVVERKTVIYSMYLHDDNNKLLAVYVGQHELSDNESSLHIGYMGSGIRWRNLLRRLNINANNFRKYVNTVVLAEFSGYFKADLCDTEKRYILSAIIKYKDKCLNDEAKLQKKMLLLDNSKKMYLLVNGLAKENITEKQYNRLKKNIDSYAKRHNYQIAVNQLDETAIFQKWQKELMQYFGVNSGYVIMMIYQNIKQKVYTPIEVY